ncbi:hypothetical protein C4572_02170 [Candidatus Parcubacteria bacterium]|nr:MAG: hypothetical protein C4572_02170 [Candidatus Parcubacteria bacterium]
MGQSEYAKAGVDYTKIEPFKRAMIEVAKRTRHFPEVHDVYIGQVHHAHGGIFEYRGYKPNIWCQTQEGLGNKNWLAEWMYMKTGHSYYFNVGIDALRMATNDNAAQGAAPVCFTDEVAAGDSDWFLDEKRSHDLGQGFIHGCAEDNVAVIAGESPSLPYLIKATLPVKSAPSISGCVLGIIAPADRLVTGEELQAGDHILGAPSSGVHSNGFSLLIKRGLQLPDQFLTALSDGRSFGNHALIPTRSYVGLVKSLLDAGVEVHSFLPGTGSGVSKIAYDERDFTYVINDWVNEVPLLMQYMLELGVSLVDCLTTFNWGIGYYVYLPAKEVDKAIKAGRRAGHELLNLGFVEKGKREVIFEPEGIALPPPGN